MRTPAAIDVETQEVLSWVKGALPAGGRGLRVLEVGCGPGYLAARLDREGLEVTAIDSSEEQVALARENGVSAVACDFLSFEGNGFDVLLFTRSLHHLSPLPEAMRKIRGLLKPGGWILADEFAHEAMNRATAAWFWDLQAVMEASGTLAPDVPRRHNHPPGHHQRHERKQEPSVDPLERWRERHVHDPPLHGAEAMLTALKSGFTVLVHQLLPYLHRYFSDRVADSEEGRRLFLLTRELETLRISQGLVVPIGLRVTARVGYSG
jgi:SAM-dependent methyltransferase